MGVLFGVECQSFKRSFIRQVTFVENRRTIMKEHKPHAQLNGNDKRTRDKRQKNVTYSPGTKPKTSLGFVPSKYK